MNILIVGQGSIGQMHRQVVLSIWPESRLSLVSRFIQPFTSDSLTSECVVYRDLKHALAFEKPDFAIVASYTSLHLEHAWDLARRNIPILIEKPLSNVFSDDLVRFGEYVKRRNLKCVIGYNLRFNPAISRMRQILLSGVYGELLHFRFDVGQALKEWRPGRDVHSTASASSEFGGGVISELSHELDLIGYLLDGNVLLGASILRRFSGLDVEDLALSLFSVESEMGVNNEVVGSLDMDFVRVRAKRSFVMQFRNASVCVDLLSNQIDVFTEGGRSEKIFDGGAVDRQYTYTKQLKAFVLYIKGGDIGQLCPLDSGLKVVNLIHKMKNEFCVSQPQRS